MCKVPDENVRIQYAHGYRAFDTWSNLKYTENQDEIVYTTAALGVVLNKKSNTQRFFNEHDDDIVCLDIHPNKNIVATG